MFNSVSRVEKKKDQFCGSYSQKKKSILRVGFKSSILWVIFLDEKTLSLEKKRVHFFESKIFKKKIKYFESRKKKVQFFESCEKGPSIWIMKKRKEQFFESNWEKKSSILWVITKMGSILSILWVFFSKKKHSIFKITLKNSILWVNF